MVAGLPAIDGRNFALWRVERAIRGHTRKFWTTEPVHRSPLYRGNSPWTDYAAGILPGRRRFALQNEVALSQRPSSAQLSADLPAIHRAGKLAILFPPLHDGSFASDTHLFHHENLFVRSA